MLKQASTSQARIVVTADDFGIAPATSAVIVRLLEAKVISSTSVMPCFDGALDSAAKYRNILNGHAGVHLQLTPGRFLTTSQPGSFLDLNARCLKPGDEGLEGLMLVEEEWRKQIECVRSAIGSITHLDSHHGIHKEEPFLGIANLLAQEYGTALRGPNGWNNDVVANPVGEYTISNWTLSRGSADGLVDEIISISKGSRVPSSIEIVTHPGIVDNELRERSSVTTLREAEIVELFRLNILLERHGYVSGWV